MKYQLGNFLNVIEWKKIKLEQIFNNFWERDFIIPRDLCCLLLKFSSP